MFSKTCEYAIRAMIFVAQHSKNGVKISVKEVAKGIDAPEYFIAKILQDLCKRFLLQSTKGPNGGFYLDEQGMKCSLADIVRMMDGNKLFSSCALGLKHCSETMPCPMHHEFKKLRAEMYLKLESAKIGTFSDELEKSLTFLKQ